MRIIKYVIFLICVFVASCFTSEILIWNHNAEYACNTYECHFDISSPDQLKILESAAQRSGVNVFVYTEVLVSAGQTEHIFYQTGTEKKASRYPLPDTYKSLINGSMTETVHPLTELNDVNEDVPFYVERGNGNAQEFFGAVSDHIKLKSKNQIPEFQSPFKAAVILIWVMCFGMIFLLSFYHVNSIRRELAIRMCFGFTIGSLILRDILIDIAVCILLIVIQCIFLSFYTSFSSAAGYLLCYTLAVLFMVLPYLSILQISVKDISNRNAGWKRLMKGSYLLKACATSLLLISFMLFSGLGITAIETYRTARSVSDLRLYDILQFETDSASEKYCTYRKELDATFATRQTLNDAYNDYYTRNLTDSMIIAHETPDFNQKSFEVIFYNDKAAPILNRIFQSELQESKADTVFLIPKPKRGISLDDYNKRISYMAHMLSKYGELYQKDAIKTIMYEKDVKIPYFTKLDSHVILYADNPYMILCRKPGKYLEAVKQKLNMFDAVIAVPKAADSIQRIEHEIPYVHASVIDLNTSIDYLLKKANIDLFSILMLIAILLVLQGIATVTLASLYHKINMKEIAVRITTGASFLTKYGSHVISTAVIYTVVGGIGLFLARKSAIYLKLAFSAFACSFLLDILILIIIHKKQEKNSVVKVLKGGIL